MLTLSAAYADSVLNKLVLEFVSRDELQDLMEKTVSFLSLTATPTSALAIDLNLLHHVGQKVGLIPPDGPAATSSFSSSTTGDVHMVGQYQ